MKKKLTITPGIINSINKIKENGKFTPAKEEYEISENKIKPQDPKEKPKEEYPAISFFQLYKYASGLDKLFLFLALIFCTIAGICNVLLCLTFGDATGTIVDYVYTTSNNSTTNHIIAEEKLVEGMTNFVIVTCSAGFGIFICTYFSTVLFNYSALRQTFKIRELFLAKILDQDISWYDMHQTGDFASRVADDLKKVEEGIGEKVSIFIFYEVTCIASILQGLIKGWKLAIICMISFPITTASMGLVAWISSKLAKQEMDAYGEAGAIAEETLSSIRTVVAFGGQAKEEERYNKHLLSARNNNIKRSVFNGMSQALMWFFTFASYSLAFWCGVTLILVERELPPEEVVYDAANMITIFYCVLIGTLYFGMASPFIEIFGMAKGAASKIFAVIASEPKINASKGNGAKIDKVEGNIAFKDVQFFYPSRPDVEVLQRFNLKIKSGETVALVGSSGCGKSTCIQLLQRFYDPTSGSVCIDGTNIQNFDLTWLRGHIGVVGQEPVLFETTIAENIRYGCKIATYEDIVKAAKKANAHTFINALPQGYNTIVGERGAQLSGGQKQRIAIARALVREPAILLLDEATSALDTNSEAVVQDALDAASNECTTIIVAHRLSTVRKADRIVVISEGRLEEQGSHVELMLAKGPYYKLVISQVSSEKNEGEPITSNTIEKTTIASEIVIETNSKRAPPSEEDVSNLFHFKNSTKLNQEEAKNETKPFSLWAVMKVNSPELWLIIIGCISSIIQGAAMPIYGIVFGDVIGVLAEEDSNYVRNEANKFALFFLILGITVGIASFLQIYTFSIAGEKLTMRLRKRMFKAMLNQEMGWFDHKDHGVGALCANLSGEAASVQGATGQRIGTILNTITTVLIALVTAFIFEWRIALVALCFSPILILSIYMEQRMMAKESEVQYMALQKSTKIAVEAISGIRTIASLGCEETFQANYTKELIPYQEIAKRNTHIRGFVFGVSRSVILFLFSASLYYGAMLVKDEGIDYAKVFIVSQVVVTSSWSLGNTLAFTPNFQKGLIAATRIFDLLNRVPQIQNSSSDVNEKWGAGNIEYQNVYFSYPKRPTMEVLKGLDLSVLQGKMVALVGPSGCGKSTIIQLLERFYDPTDGQVTIDRKGIEKMHLSALRSHLGVVSQEPNLFSKTIAENIAYGDNSRMVSRSEIINAAKKANIHNFIASLPLGYETKLGEKGTQLSGGQRQRVAIARALVRNPKVLLLDEATSALDAESERVVQETLDKAKIGRTCISIAHRLSTSQDADVICVINHGRIAEMGTHSELLSLKGLYCNLHRLQNG